MPKEKFNSFGQSEIRVDAVAKVTGKARYTEDLTMPGMKHAALVRSSIAHGRVVSLDFSEAKKLPGVLEVYTYKDVPDILYPTAGHPYNLLPQKRDAADRKILTDYVRQHGDEIAVVVANDHLTAVKAASLVKVEYEEYPVMLNKESALAEGAKPLHENISKTNLLGHHVMEAGGDVKAMLAEAEIVVEGTYKTPIVQHCHMETVVSYAYMDSNDHIVIVSSTQIPHIIRRIVGMALNLPWSKIKVIKPYLGGGFGNKQDMLVEALVAFLTFKMDGVPVQVTLSREEVFLATRTRHLFEGEGKLALKQDGTAVAMDLHVYSNTGAYASHGHSIAGAAGSKSPYLYPRMALRYEATTYYSNMPTAGAMRGYGQPQAMFFVDCLIEEAAHKLGMDPLAIRLKNAAVAGDICHASKAKINVAGLVECLKKGAELIDWDKKRKEYQNQNGSIRRGVGVACFSYGSNTYPSSVELAGVRLTLNQDGRVTLSAGATEIGQGADTAMAQMAAEAIGVAFNSINVVSFHDTDLTPFDTGAYASRQTYTSAPAISSAARIFKEKILSLANQLTGVPQDALKIVGENIVGYDGKTVIITLKDLAIQSYYNIDIGTPIVAEAFHKTRVNPPVFGCSFVDLEVDVPLCRIKVNKLINLHDSGLIVNPVLSSGQVHGGMAMGLAMGLYEEMLIDDKGLLLNGNFLDYKIPTIMDVPNMECVFIEKADPLSPFGVRALGEPPLVSPAPAIRNAVWHATGVKVNELPITPKTLFRYLSKEGM